MNNVLFERAKKILNSMTREELIANMKSYGIEFEEEPCLLPAASGLQEDPNKPATLE